MEKNYKFGEYLLKEGTAPEGMFIILDGQCRICLDNSETRNCKLSAVKSLEDINFSPNIDDLGMNGRKEEGIQTDIVDYPRNVRFL